MYLDVEAWEYFKLQDQLLQLQTATCSVYVMYVCTLVLCPCTLLHLLFVQIIALYLTYYKVHTCISKRLKRVFFAGEAGLELDWIHE